MSSYSEWLRREQQRQQKVVDTRIRTDAGTYTDMVKRQAASVSLENAACPTGGKIQGGHRVKDASEFLAYTSGQAVAQGLAANTKLPQMAIACCPSDEYNDKLAKYPHLAARQKAINELRCEPAVRGPKPHLTDPCGK